MLCRKPFRRGLHEFGCGQCIPCRINRRNKWATRLKFEMANHKDVSFLTLTYAEEHLPEGGSLCYRDLTLFLKRLRKAIAPTVVRYFATGEYGEMLSRPHYHLLLFGYPPCTFGLSRYKDQSRRGVNLSCCSPCDLIRNTWTHPDTWAPYGHIQLEALRKEGVFNYVVGYVTKKLDKYNPKLGGREPERGVMSRRPGLGFDYVTSIGRAQMSPPGQRLMGRDGDVTRRLVGAKGRTIALDRYIRDKLREECGIEWYQVNGASLDRDRKQVQELQASLFGDKKIFLDWLKGRSDRNLAREQSSLNAEAKMKIGHRRIL